MKTLALALGAGGARGLAAIAVLEALDDLTLRPAALAGASVGALLGAAYAAGIGAKAIRRHVLTLAHDRAEMWRRLMAIRVGRWSELLTAPARNPVLVDAEGLVAALLPPEVPDTFEALPTPLTVIAADLHGRRKVVFDSGPLRPALAASAALPGLVRPVRLGERVLVDGGAVDPLPFGDLFGRADIVAAVDCSAGAGAAGDIPDAWDSVFATITLMGQTIVAERLRERAPDLVLRPNVGQFRLLDFFLASAILRAAEPIRAEARAHLAALLE